MEPMGNIGTLRMGRSSDYFSRLRGASGGCNGHWVSHSCPRIHLSGGQLGELGGDMLNALKPKPQNPQKPKHQTL